MAFFGVVTDQSAVVLVAVEFENVNRLAVGRPRHVGEIHGFPVHFARRGQLLGIVAFRCFEINRFAGLQIVDSNRHIVALFACHRVFVGLVGRRPRLDVHLRIVGHFRLVHPIEGQSLPVGAPEHTFADAKLAAMHALAIDDFA